MLITVFFTTGKLYTVDGCNVNEETMKTSRFVMESIRLAVGSAVDIHVANELHSAHFLHIPDVKKRL